MSPTSVLVIGAGELGLAILQALAAHPNRPTISVLLRPSTSPSRQNLLAQLKQLNISIIHGDLSSPLSNLVPLLQPFDTVISATGFASGPGTQLHLASAVLEAKVAWYFPWQFGVDYDVIGRGSSQPLFDEQLDVRDLLRGQAGTAWTIVSTGIFTSFLFDPAFGVVNMDKEAKKVRVTALGAWQNGLTMTSASDIGRVTADIVCKTKNKGVVYTAGDSVTFAEVAEAFESRGWEVDRALTTVDELEKARKDRPDDLGPKYGLIWASGVGVGWDKDATYNATMGMELESMGSWIETHL